jgi:predicted O-methyltransferase YrrM
MVPVFRVTAPLVRSLTAAASWQTWNATEVPVNVTGDGEAAKQKARAFSHNECLRLFLQTEASHAAITEDDVVLLEDNWLKFRSFDLFVPFSSHRKVIPPNESILAGDLPKFCAQSYLISRRLAAHILQALPRDANLTIHQILRLSAKRFSVASFKGNAAQHDLFVPSLIHLNRGHKHSGGTPLMGESEISAILSFLKPEMRVLEYGAGGSTIFFAGRVRAWTAVEHNKYFAESVKAILAASALKHVNVLYVPQNIPVDPIIYGPYSPGYDDAFRDYILKSREIEFDAVLVDGRARLAVARTTYHLLPPGGVIFFHDFFARGRERYREFLREAILVHKIVGGQTLAIFRKEC